MIQQDPHSEKAARLVAELEKHLDFSTLPEELCLVVGGDGFLLRAIKEGGNDLTYLGLNAGSLGFMLNDVSEPAETAALLAEGAWQVEQVPRLAMRGLTSSGDEVGDLALNDVYLERMTGQLVHVQIRIDGVVAVERMTCDGVIVSTALGSTAYAYSAGGPACHPGLRLLQLTAICPHLPRLPPITLPPTADVDIEVLDSARRPARVVSDGRGLQGIERIRVGNANSDIKLAYLRGHHPTATLIRKLIQA